MEEKPVAIPSTYPWFFKPTSSAPYGTRATAGTCALHRFRRFEGLAPSPLGVSADGRCFVLGAPPVPVLSHVQVTKAIAPSLQALAKQASDVSKVSGSRSCTGGHQRLG
jgi:hypothetical protein